jgi:hypothetical protein
MNAGRDHGAEKSEECNLAHVLDLNAFEALAARLTTAPFRVS